MKLVPNLDWKSRLVRRGKVRNKHLTTSFSKDASTIPRHILREHTLIRDTCSNFLTDIEPHYYPKHIPKFMARATRENFVHDGTFHQAVAKVFLVAEFFGMMPVRGLLKSHPRELSFSWWNVRTLYSVSYIIMSLLDAGVALYKVLKHPITINSLEPIIFRGSIIMVCFSALRLARQWPELMVYWYEIESDLPQYIAEMDKRRMADRIQLVAFVIMMLSMGEHIVNQISIIVYSQTCPSDKDPIKSFFMIANSEIFFIFNYSHALAWLGKIENILSTFVWNYMDVFVIIISIGLASKFQQLNDNLMKFKGMQMPETFWSERRIQYRNLCMLCEKIDNAISVITMVSFSNNLYFICVQLLKTLNKMPSFAHALYFYYSLLYLIGRTLAVSLYTASVNDESRKPLRVLRCVPRESWCAEVKRFADEICSDLIALSGMKFFHLTRKLVLSVAGTIVTYELVLIQFHEDTGTENCPRKQS